MGERSGTPEPAVVIDNAVPAPAVMSLPAVEFTTTFWVPAALFELRTIAGPAVDEMSPSMVALMPPDPAPPLAIT